MSWAAYKKGQRCSICTGNKRKTISEVYDYIFSNGDLCLSNNYNGAFSYLKIKCGKCNKVYNSTWTNYQSGKRCVNCAILNRTGENSYLWKGGISCEPYCDVWLDKDYKESIKKRDNYQCQNDSCFETSTRLCLHHINYIKKDCNPKNLITLCTSCNTRANTNREFWEIYYKQKIRSIYNG